MSVHIANKFINHNIHQSAHPSVCPSISLPIHLSICLVSTTDTYTDESLHSRSIQPEDVH